MQHNPYLNNYLSLSSSFIHTYDTDATRTIKIRAWASDQYVLGLGLPNAYVDAGTRVVVERIGEASTASNVSVGQASAPSNEPVERVTTFDEFVGRASGETEDSTSITLTLSYNLNESALILYRVVTSTVPKDISVGADDIKVELTSPRSPFPFNYADSAGNVGGSISSEPFAQAILSGFGAEPHDHGIRLFATRITAQDFGYNSNNQVPVLATVTPFLDGEAGEPVTKVISLYINVRP